MLHLLMTLLQQDAFNHDANRRHATRALQSGFALLRFLDQHIN